MSSPEVMERVAAQRSYEEVLKTPSWELLSSAPSARYQGPADILATFVDYYMAEGNLGKKTLPWLIKGIVNGFARDFKTGSALKPQDALKSALDYIKQITRHYFRDANFIATLCNGDLRIGRVMLDSYLKLFIKDLGKAMSLDEVKEYYRVQRMWHECATRESIKRESWGANKLLKEFSIPEDAPYNINDMKAKARMQELLLQKKYGLRKHRR